ncbi:MAG TPA: hypothetical protein VF131_09135 [Blastocatellia bacterium]|nr:hypothetical protein [Blastocatellia bacterium]
MSIRLLLLLMVILVTSIAAWVVKQRMKKEMQHGLGREVTDSELTSISAWMKVPPERQGPSTYSTPTPNTNLVNCFRCGAPNYHGVPACHHCAIPFGSAPPPGNPYTDPR